MTVDFSDVTLVFDDKEHLIIIFIIGDVTSAFDDYSSNNLFLRCNIFRKMITQNEKDFNIKFRIR